MRDNDRAAFVATLETMAHTYGFEPNEAWFDGYWLGLSDLVLEDFRSAIKKAIETLDFLPRPSQIRMLTKDPLEIRSSEAWDSVLAAIRGYCEVNPRKMGDPVLDRIVGHMGGLGYLSGLEKEQLHSFSRRRFDELFAAYDARDQDPIRRLEPGEHTSVEDLLKATGLVSSEPDRTDDIPF